MSKVSGFLLPVFVALAVVGCGGGGGGGGSGTGSSGGGDSTATSVVITASNAQAVAAEALEVSTDTDVASMGSGFVTGVQLSGPADPDPMALASAARLLAGKASGSGALATGVVMSQPCSAGGSLTIDTNSSGNGVLKQGDTYQITANNCVESDGTNTITMNGAMAISILSGSYDPVSTVYPKSFSMRMVATNFSVSAGGQAESFNGDLTMSTTENSAESISTNLSATTLSSKVGSHTVTLTNYSAAMGESAGGLTQSVTATVQTNNSRLGTTTVSYSIATLTPIAVSASGAITAGSIKVTGAGSVLLLTATSADTFSLQVDANGDGTYDSTSSVTRSQLQALL